MKISKKIIFSAYDAGGMDSLIPVIKNLKKKKGFELLLLCGGPALKLAVRNKLKATNTDRLKVSGLEKKAVQFQPDLIVTGTSSGVRVEKKLLRIAQKHDFKIISIVDFWMNYNLKFSFDKNGKMRINDLPDYILVMDDLAKKEMVKEGFPKEKIVITGNPHFDGFKQFPILKNKKNIFFIDQHFSELIKKGIHEDVGYNEKQVFFDIITALESLGWSGSLLIKFHPGSKDLKRYDTIIKKSILTIKKTSKKDTLHKLFNKSFLVVGMTSMALFEAALSGKLVLSYQPHSKRKVDPLITNRLGLSHFAYSKPKLKNALENVLSLKKPTDPHSHRALIKRYTKSNATKKVITFIVDIASKYENDA